MDEKACKPLPPPEALPNTRDLLLQGGDTRISLGVSGCNEYGCGPDPDPELVSFNSSTASTISESGFAAADALRKRISTEADRDICKREFDRIRHEIKSLYHLDGVNDLKIIFAASGTDAHLIASRLINPEHIIMVGQSETGKGVSAALSGRHFSTKSSHCCNLKMGEALLEGHTAEVSEVAIRTDEGHSRSINEIDKEIEERVQTLLVNSPKVLLVVVDVSKTGMIVPSTACAIRLKKKFPSSLDVLIDACQSRISSSTLQAYLSMGFMIAVTGSKFITGPAFSGALLIPGTVKTVPPPKALAAYCSKSEWPDNMQSDSLGSANNWGLLLRWEAALAELRQFQKIKETEVKRVLSLLADVIQTSFENNSNIKPLTVPPLNRGLFSNIGCWDQVQTIFPFLLQFKGRILKNTEICQVHTLLQEDLSHLSNHPLASLRCILGQPVAISPGYSVLRLCSSARLVAEGKDDTCLIIRQIMSILDKIGLILELSR